MWPKIKEQFPDATLDVFADINGKWVNEVASAEMDAIRVLLRRGLAGVNMRGWVSKQELADAWATADIWFYPTTFKETFCLTALEAAASGTLAIGTYLAALEETVGDRGILIPGDASTTEWHDKAMNELFAVMRDTERKHKLIQANKEWADSMSWKSRAIDMLTKHIKPTLGLGILPTIVEEKEEIDTGGMLGWQYDLPKGQGEKEMFEKILDLHRGQKARILEVGTFAGTSLIAMMNRLPDSTGVAIDRWESYIEKSSDTVVEELSTMTEKNIEQLFHKNMRIAGLTDRVKAYKGDSVDKLLELVERKERFDFIYVDGSHKCIDCYTDMALSWKLLDIGGTLAVDDYMYCYSEVEMGNAYHALEYPKKGVDHFLEKYKGRYLIIGKQYRLFLKKISE
jgi:predicted O-methyltransferase YrrM